MVSKFCQVDWWNNGTWNKITHSLRLLDTLITSRTRVKLLLKFFSNSGNTAYLRSLAKEFGDSTNGVRVELNRLTRAGLLESEPSGNTVLYKANTDSPLFSELNNIVSKYLGFDRILENVVRQLGELEASFIVGSYAEGRDDGLIELVLVGNIRKDELFSYVRRTEKLIRRKVKPLILNAEEFESSYKAQMIRASYIVLWGNNT